MCGLTVVFDFVCDACAVYSRLVDRPAVYGWSWRSVKYGVVYEGKKASKNTALVPAMRGNEEKQTN